MKKLVMLLVMSFLIGMASTTYCQVNVKAKTEQLVKDSSYKGDSIGVAVDQNTSTLSNGTESKNDTPFTWADKVFVFLESSFGIILLRAALRYWPSKWNIDIFILVRKILEYAIKFIDIIYGGFVTNRKSDGTTH